MNDNHKSFNRIRYLERRLNNLTTPQDKQKVREQIKALKEGDKRRSK